VKLFCQYLAAILAKSCGLRLDKGSSVRRLAADLRRTELCRDGRAAFAQDALARGPVRHKRLSLRGYCHDIDRNPHAGRRGCASRYHDMQRATRLRHPRLVNYTVSDAI
jgi:hypothetical protein